MSGVFDMVTDGKVCPKCGSTNTHDHWSNPDDHGIEIIHNWRCKDCGWDDSKKTMTNGDKIRQMSDEELAEFLSDLDFGCSHCPASNICFKKEFDNCGCDEVIPIWLKQEAKDD